MRMRSEPTITIEPVAYPSDWHHFEAIVWPVREAAEALLKEFYGDRCPDFEETCICCQQWARLDALAANPFDPPLAKTDQRSSQHVVAAYEQGIEVGKCSVLTDGSSMDAGDRGEAARVPAGTCENIVDTMMAKMADHNWKGTIPVVIDDLRDVLPKILHEVQG